MHELLDTEDERGKLFFSHLNSLQVPLDRLPLNPSLLACSAASGVVLIGCGTSVRVVRDSAALCAASQDDFLKASGAVLELPAPCARVAWSPDCDLAAVACSDGTLLVFTAADLWAGSAQPCSRSQVRTTPSPAATS